MKTKIVTQKIYTSSYADELYLQRSSSDRVKQYGGGDFSFLNDNRTIPVEIELMGDEPKLVIESGDSGKHDGKNAELLYESYRGIPIDLAFDKGFWTYMTHNNYSSYVMSRWIKVSEPGVGTIQERFFTQSYSTDRGLERNALARLWWAAHLTTNFEENPELDYFFHDKNDPYFFTKILCGSQNLWTQIYGHTFGRGKKILLAALQHTYDNRSKIERKQKPYALFISNRICLYEQNQSLIYYPPEKIMQVLGEIAAY